ncbi:MAG TPA: MFS transporter [Thermodesulfobacteriota bacterium]|nr:MFS transporter [Thermodesulfobacteriota bacterium]
MNYRLIGMLFLGHLFTDINQGALPAMLPFLIPAHDLSYAAAAGIVFAGNIASTVVQPVFGNFADRFSKPFLMPLGLLLAGIGLSLAGVASDYPTIILVAVISGVGIAAFHPEGARRVNYLAGEKKATAMSIFGVGGTLGFAFGPLIVTAAMLSWGLKGSLILIVPVCFMAFVFIFQLKKFASFEAKSGPKTSGPSAGPDLWGAFSRLCLTAVGRSILFYGLNTFIPLYWITVLNQSKAAAATALTIMAAAGVFGNLLGGRLSDHFGHRWMIVASFGALTLFLPALLWVTTVSVATILLVPIGMAMSSCYSPIVVLGQKFLPNHIGLASGFTLGVTISIGGMTAPLLGKIADMYGIWTALAAILFVPVLSAVIGLTLAPPHGRQKATASA